MDEETEQFKVFVGGVSWMTTEESLREHFEKFGTVARVAIARDRYTGAPRGFAFVSFTDQSAFDSALLVEHHHILGRTVDVKRAIPRSEQYQIESQQGRGRGLGRNTRINGNGRNIEQLRTRKIFVGGLSANLTEEEFRNYFENFGQITDVVVMHDSLTQRPRGFGFITFDSEESVENVMRKSFHELGGKQVEVKRAVPKEATNNGYSGGVGGRSHNGLQPYGYSPRNDLFHGHGLLPPYGAHPGYGGFFGYPYGLYGVGFPAGYGGISYGMAPFAPGSWNGLGMSAVRGYPYAGAPNFYPPYPNGGVGGRGLAVNRVDDAQVAVDRKSSGTDGGNGLLAN